MRIGTLTIAILATLASTALANTTTLFTAEINNLGAVNSAGDVSQETDMRGTGRFTLTEFTDGSSPTLAYQYEFEGVDLGGETQLDGSDDLTANPDDNAIALHIHDTTGVSYSAGTPHVLNLFGFPARDDSQVVVDIANSTITGEWDDGDLAMRGPAGDETLWTQTLTDTLDALKSGELFAMVHTTSPRGFVAMSGITLGGRIVQVPEPASVASMTLAALAGLGLLRLRRRSV